MDHTPPPEDHGARPGRSSRKRREILAAATNIFLQNGYLGTNLDEVASLASVSKMTIYKHFSDKETLFVAIVTGMVNKASDAVHAELQELGDSGDVEADLRDLACRQLNLVMQPQMMQLRRLVIGEVKRFPRLGQVFYDRGPKRTIEALAQAFGRLAAKGLLKLEDPRLAAEQFNWLVMSQPLNQAMLLGDEAIPDAEETRRHIGKGVAMFLAAYSTGPKIGIDSR